MSSSPEANVHRRITTRSHDSGLHPSLFGPESLVVTPSMVTSVQSVGCSCQKAAPAKVTPWMSTRAHPIVSTIAVLSRPTTTRSSGVSPRATRGSRTPSRSEPRFQAAVREASSVPLPVTATSVSSQA